MTSIWKELGRGRLPPEAPNLKAEQAAGAAKEGKGWACTRFFLETHMCFGRQNCKLKGGAVADHSNDPIPSPLVPRPPSPAW